RDACVARSNVHGDPRALLLRASGSTVRLGLLRLPINDISTGNIMRFATTNGISRNSPACPHDSSFSGVCSITRTHDGRERIKAATSPNTRGSFGWREVGAMTILKTPKIAIARAAKTVAESIKPIAMTLNSDIVLTFAMTGRRCAQRDGNPTAP